MSFALAKMRYATPLLAALLLPVAAPSPAPAAATASQLERKAAFLPRFARYVRWPEQSAPGPGEPFRLCVIGRDPFGRLLDAAAARETADGREFEVQRFETARDAQSCHIAFVQGATPAETARLLTALDGLPVLTVTDGRESRQRGLIHLVTSAGRVRFFIDEAAAARQDLTISSRLLALALGVRQRRP